MPQLYSKRDGATFQTRARDVIVLAEILALGVVVWGYFFHLRIVDGEDISLRGPLLHLATDSLLALPPALLAVLAGLWLAQRFGRVLTPGHRLVLSAILVSLAFFVVMVPSFLLHGYIDSTVFGEWEAHHGAEDGGLLGLILHALRDAFLTSMTVVLPLVLVGRALLALLDGRWLGGRQKSGPAGEGPPRAQTNSFYDREVGRRDVLKYGGVGAGVLALNASGLLTWPELARMLSSGGIESPRITPFTLPLKIPPVIQPVGTVQTKDRFDEATLNELEEVRLKLLEQGMKVDMSVADRYELRQQVAQVQILPPGMPKTTIWGYNGITPGPTFRVKRGKPIVVTHINELPVRTCAHPHGLDVQSASDGHPAFLLAPEAGSSPARFPTRPLLPGEAQGCGEEPQEGKFKTFHVGSQDHFYPNMQEAAPLWYHDHAIHRTGRNVYMGLAGFYLIEDDVEQSLSLPGNPRFDDQREFDVPLVLQDRLIGEDGSLIYPCDGDRAVRQGVFGDVILVNGVPMPFLEVKRRKYRFRFLNGSNARVYSLALSTGEPFTVIASDGGLLHKPVTTPEILISMSERYEAVIDFSRYPIGTKVILENRRGPAFGDPIDEAKTRQVMRFDVVEDADDPSSIPAVLRPHPYADELPESSAVRTRDFRFERRGGFWTINGETFDLERNDAEPELGDIEIWRFINKSGGWVHPIHVHLVEFRVLDRNGEKPRPVELDRKDSVLLGPNETIRVIMKLQHCKGKYVIHCHNIEHEDHDMMGQFEVV